MTDTEELVMSLKRSAISSQYSVSTACTSDEDQCEATCVFSRAPKGMEGKCNKEYLGVFEDKEREEMR